MNHYRVFISYAHADRALVEQLVNVLNEAGLVPLWDRDLIPGTGFSEQIQSFITNSHIFLPFITPASAKRPWLKAIKDQTIPDDQPVETNAGKQLAGDLRRQLLVTQPGDSIAYLTDFLLEDQDAEDRLVEMLQDCRIMVCENNYADADADLAKKNFHMTASDVGRLAARIQPESLVLFHLSDRYTTAEWQAQLREVQEHFAKTTFPEGWNI